MFTYGYAHITRFISYKRSLPFYFYLFLKWDDDIDDDYYYYDDDNDNCDDDVYDYVSAR